MIPARDTAPFTAKVFPTPRFSEPLENVNAETPVTAAALTSNNPPSTRTAPDPSAVAFWTTKAPALICVVPEYRFAAASFKVPNPVFLSPRLEDSERLPASVRTESALPMLTAKSDCM